MTIRRYEISDFEWSILSLPSFGRKLFCEAHASIKVPSTVSVSAVSWFS